ncbi:hypothetical protein PABG_12640 [Paracoccidioides brasiliensis Pb03]|uniref:Uncharacterized protein n=2 Tax=Paracoccidioides brasiliensis TaxID=121759 RepID=A0A0A0HT77_PARBD|nr:uncharacterized protein PADG_11220 [Paracoccidioides brasiliensis Pb18]KGM92409.1 hypothetical protein PADG_11220 [Paracoccidioides brasiliensis Pb18]KGY14501.1 hypothetical protein PABG_12640 [Paracoccidioides brasiliensis Pb03]ODH41441.1 hypothetical protein ACO22_01403 [Paracoccidioides brasiliensis]ODH48240.1 hypothetical protein GX48_05638 [Paracoccidioides brasiliensis]
MHCHAAKSNLNKEKAKSGKIGKNNVLQNGQKWRRKGGTGQGEYATENSEKWKKGNLNGD